MRSRTSNISENAGVPTWTSLYSLSVKHSWHILRLLIIHTFGQRYLLQTESTSVKGVTGSLNLGSQPWYRKFETIVKKTLNGLQTLCVLLLQRFCLLGHFYDLPHPAYIYYPVFSAGSTVANLCLSAWRTTSRRVFTGFWSLEKHFLLYSICTVVGTVLWALCWHFLPIMRKSEGEPFSRTSLFYPHVLPGSSRYGGCGCFSPEGVLINNLFDTSELTGYVTPLTLFRR